MKLSTDLSNQDYHAMHTHFSSSQIKLILDSPKKYHQKYILKNLKNESSDAMDVGTAIHMRVLEPEEYTKQVKFFSGPRRGKAWEEFKTLNKDKLILGDMQKIQLDTMYTSFVKSKLGPELIAGGHAEVSLFTELQGHDIRVRADYINVEKGIIFDLKSTSGTIEEEKFKRSAEGKMYGYDLQAALYVDAFSKYYGKTFDFCWIVMSKDFNQIEFFKASTAMIKQGRNKYIKALALIDDYEKNGWVFETKMIELMPSSVFSWEDNNED